MASFEAKANKRKKQNKLFRLAKKGYITVVRPSSKQDTAFKGGLVRVRIHSTRKPDGGYDISLKKMPDNSKDTYGLFVAGGPEVDRLVASANASLHHPTSVAVPKR